MKKVSIKGVIIGSVTDMVATYLVMFFFFFIYVIATRNLGGSPSDQMSKMVILAIHGDSILSAIQIILGSLCSVLGGYIAARIAKRNELLNGSLAAFLCMGSGLYGLFFGSVTEPFWQFLVGFLANPALSGFGGYLRLKTVPPKPDA